MARSKRKQRLQLLPAGVLGCVVIAAVCVMLIHDRRPAIAGPPQALAAANQQPAPNAAAPEVINRGLPVRLIIPKLGISANIGYTGLTKNGEMQVPGNVHDVGWYKYGTLPGNKGSAVMAGHLDGQKGEPGVFTALERLGKGDTLSVVDDKDQAVLFVVREIKVYGQHERPDEVFNGTDGDGVHLNLITCTGAWDKDQRRFTQRLVVFTDQAI